MIIPRSSRDPMRVSGGDLPLPPPPPAPVVSAASAVAPVVSAQGPAPPRPPPQPPRWWVPPPSPVVQRASEVAKVSCMHCPAKVSSCYSTTSAPEYHRACLCAKGWHSKKGWRCPNCHSMAQNTLTEDLGPLCQWHSTAIYEHPAEMLQHHAFIGDHLDRCVHKGHVVLQVLNMHQGIVNGHIDVIHEDVFIAVRSVWVITGILVWWRGTRPLRRAPTGRECTGHTRGWHVLLGHRGWRRGNARAGAAVRLTGWWG